MSRAIQPRSESEQVDPTLENLSPPPTPDSLVTALVKIIPSEAVATYLFLDGALASMALGEHGEVHRWFLPLFIGVSTFVWAGSIAYLMLSESVKGTQLLMSALAFPAWVLATGKCVGLAFPGIPVGLGSIVLALYTFGAGVYAQIRLKRG